MGKVIYFKSPLDPNHKEEFNSLDSIENILIKLDIEKKPLSVTLNGETPDDVDLFYQLSESDLLEIRQPVEGGGSSAVKRDLATIVQISALIAAALIGGPIGAVILVGGQLISGALNKWAMDLTKRPHIPEANVSVDANQYSLTNASNEVRQLRPIPVVVGSHRMAPDVHTDASRRQYGRAITSDLSDPFLESFYAGIIQSNGPDAVNNSWATMPANYIAPGLPMYEIKIAPYGFTKKTTALTPSENADIINEVAGLHLAPSMINFNEGRILISPIYSGYPAIIYHSDPADPYYRRFNTLWSLYRVYEFLSNNYSLMSNLFAGTVPAGGTIYFFHSVPSGTISWNTYLLRGVYYANVSIPAGLVYNDTFTDQFSAYGAFLLALNGGSYTNSAKTTSPQAPVYFYDLALAQTKPGIPYSSQLFNFGFGDIEISQRKVGTVDVIPAAEKTIGYSSIDKTNPAVPPRWRVVFVSSSDIGFVVFYNDVLNFPPKKLLNTSFSSGLIPYYDTDPHNFVYFAGQLGMDSFYFAISGRIYRTTSGAIASNTTRLQLQWKWSSQSTWNEFSSPIITITNDDTNEIYLDYTVDRTTVELQDPLGTRSQNEYLEVRIRKVNLDSTDRDDGRVSELSIVDANFFGSHVSNMATLAYKQNAPMNLDGLYLTALITDNAQTNKYSAFVEAKCWYYDYDNEVWVWGKTRNPAFWFLFFAHGGFYNFDSMATDVWPYSPTYGWQNYPGHSGNTDLIFGAGLTNDQIDLDAIIEWGQFCLVNNLNIDMVIKEEAIVAETLEKIANIGRASVSYYGGKISVVVEDPLQVPVCLYGMGNMIAGSFSVEYAVGDPIRSVIGTFVNRETWETENVEAIVPFSDSSIVKSLEITLDGITDRDQAQREVNILAARQYFQRRTYSWKTDIEGFLAKRGDLVHLSHDSTQYGYSGRVISFVVESGVVVGIKTTAKIGTDVSYVTIRDPENNLETYECEYQDGMIKFLETYPIERAPRTVNLNDDNALSEIPGSIAEDFVFIADIKETSGKKVRISQVEVDEQSVFTITAVDEDPSMWAYEFNDAEPAVSTEDSIVTLEVHNLRFLDLGAGRIRLLWDMDAGDFAQIIDLNSNLPIEANGQYSFSKGDVIIELTPGVKFELEVRPLSVGTPYRSIPKKVTVWPL